MGGLTLLMEAREAGLTVTAQGGRLTIRGPRRAEAIARRVLEHKVELLAALASSGPMESRPPTSVVPKLAAIQADDKPQGHATPPEQAAAARDGAERPKGGRPETAGGQDEPAGRPQLEGRADREVTRFLATCRPWPDGKGLYDPALLRDRAGQAYLAWAMAGRPGQTSGEKRGGV